MNNPELSRRIFWWTLFVLFWITSTVVISYAFGYRFSLSRGIFVYAGSVTIKTTPQEVDVYVNNELHPGKQLNRLNGSYHIGGILPGEYNLEVRSPGYNTWTKKINVHSGISTEFWNVVLTKESYKQTPYLTSGVDRFFISPRKNLTAAVQQNEDVFSIKIVSASENTAEEVFSTNEYLFTDNEKENIEWTPQAHRIIIPAIKKETKEKNYFIVDISTKEVLNLKDITGTSDLSHVRWDPKTKDVLFYVSTGNLFRIDLDAKENIREIAKNISSYELASEGLYYFQLPSGIVYKTSFDGNDAHQQLTISAPDMTDGNYQIIAYDDNRLTLLNSSGKLYIYNRGENDDHFAQLSSSALGSQFSDDGKKLLFWNDREVFVYFVRKWDVKPTRYEGEIIPITRYINEIKNVQWSRDYEHVILTVDKKIKFIEIDQRGHRNIMDIISLNSEKARVINNNSNGLIYFSDLDNQNTFRLQTIEFPEKTTLLQGIFSPEENSSDQILAQ